MRIGELAKVFGLRPSALRFYERAGVLKPAGRISGRREYDTASQRRVAFILSARDSGLTVPEIRTLILESDNGTPPKRLWKAAAASKRRRLENEIARLQAAQHALMKKANCRCTTLEQCETLLARERMLRTA